MKQRRHAKRMIGVLPLALSLLLGACAPPPQSPAGQDQTPGSSTPAATFQLLGKAFLDAPIAGARLKLIGTSGQVFHEAANATDENGYFSLPFQEGWPRDFRAEVSGGTLNGLASPHLLKADIRNFNPLVDRVYLNAATTLVAAKLDLTPSLALSDAQNAVARFLLLPEGLSLGVDLDNPALQNFHHGAFMKKAGGNLNAYINGLAPQITGDAETTEDFSNPNLQIAGKIAKTVALELGKGAIGHIGGTLMGKALGAIFGDDGTGQRHEEILAQFREQRLMLNRLDNQMVALQGSINSLKAEIAQLGQAMVEQFGLAAYNAKVDALLTPIGTIDGLYLSYMDEIQRRDGSEAGKARIEALANEIRNRVPSALTTIHLAMLGTGGGDGAIAQWHRVVGNKNRKGEGGGNRYPYLVNANFVNQLNDQYEYFEGVQLRGITLLVEARNFRNDDVGAKSDYERFMANLEAQEKAIYSLRLETNEVLLSPLAGVMWDKSPLMSSGAVRSFQITNGKVPTEALTALEGHTKEGFSDWRLPTSTEFTRLAASENDRDFTQLGHAGFNFSKLNKNYLISSTEFEKDWFIALDRRGWVNALPQSSSPMAAILPVRTFKKDPLATL